MRLGICKFTAAEDPIAVRCGTSRSVHALTHHSCEPKLEGLEPRVLMASGLLPIALGGDSAGAMLAEVDRGPLGLDPEELGPFFQQMPLDVGFLDRSGTNPDLRYRGFAWLDTGFGPSGRVAIDSVGVQLNWTFNFQDAGTPANFNGLRIRYSEWSVLTRSLWNTSYNPQTRYYRLDDSTTSLPGTLSLNTSQGQHTLGPIQDQGLFRSIQQRRSSGQQLLTAYIESPESGDTSFLGNDSSRVRLNPLQWTVNYVATPAVQSPLSGSRWQNEVVRLQWVNGLLTGTTGINFRVQWSESSSFPDNATTNWTTTSNHYIDIPANSLSPGQWYWRVQARNSRVGYDPLTRYGHDDFTSGWGNGSVLILNPAPEVASVTINPTAATRGSQVTIQANGVWDNTGVASVTFLREMSNGSLELLGSRSSAPWSITYTIPLEWSVGTHQIVAIAEDNYGLESARRYASLVVNNMLPVITDLNPPSQTIQMGSEFTLTATAHDPDGQISEVRLFRDLNGNGQWNQGEIWWPMESIGNGQYRRTLSADWEGSRQFSAVARDNDGAWSAVRTATVTVQLVPRPNLLISSLIEPPSNIEVGASLTVGGTILNNGNAAAASFRTTLWLGSTNVNAPASDRRLYRLTDFDLTGLASGGSSALQRSVVLSAPLGFYRIWAMTDSDSMVQESNELDNWGSSAIFTIGTVPHPNLLITSITDPPSSWQVNSDVTLGAVLRNEGSVGAGQFNVTFWLGDTSLAASESQRKQHQLGPAFSVSSLASGATASVSGSRTVQAPAGTYRLWAMVDSGNSINESDENDNWRASEIIVEITPPPGLPDLVVSSIHGVNGPYRPGDEVNVIATLRNIGDDVAHSPKVSFYLGDANRDNPRLLVGLVPVTTLEAGGSGSTSADLTIPSDLPAGEYFIWVKADPEDQIAEHDESNNWRRSSLPVLQPSAIAVPAASAGERLTVTVKNQNGRVVYSDRADAGWQSLRYPRQDDPAIIGDPLSWTDPKDGKTYIAAISTTRQLLLWTQDNGGSWSRRNLTAEPGNGLLIDGQITTYINRDGSVVIAGVTSNNHIVEYRQTGESTLAGATWGASNLTVRHNLPIIGFEGRLVSYVPSWNAEHIAGLDSQGRIWSVWRGTPQDNWVVTNLTAVSGAPLLSGGLTVYLPHGWDGINLAGVNASGEVVVTWWVPEFHGQWRTNNLTREVSGPVVQPDSTTSFVTPWDGLNIVAADSSGSLVIYWWTPTLREVIGRDSWAVERLSTTVSFGPRPASAMTGMTSQGSEISIFGVTSESDLFRYWWLPNEPWRAEVLGSM